MESEPLHQLNPDSLIERSGCALVLTLSNGQFKGSTDERSCPSSLRGSSYATSEVVITENQLTSLDRGFDENDNQVWGSEYGPYIFKKASSLSE
jgi:hypothetical protein